MRQLTRRTAFGGEYENLVHTLVEITLAVEAESQIVEYAYGLIPIGALRCLGRLSKAWRLAGDEQRKGDVLAIRGPHGALGCALELGQRKTSAAVQVQHA